VNDNPFSSQPLSGIFVVAIAGLCIVFGANAVAIKVSLTGLGTFTAAGLRFSMAAAAVAVWAKFTGRPFKLRPHQLVPVLCLSLMFTVQLSLFYLGLSLTYASRGALIVNLLPFFVLVLSHFFIPGDSITMKKLAGIALGFSGVAFLLLENQATSAQLRSGDMIILGAAVLWAGNAVYTKRIIEGYHAFQLVFYPMLIAGPLILIEGWLLDPVMIGHLTSQVVAALLYQGLICAAFGFVAWSMLLKKFGATTLHSFVFIMPVSAVVFSSLILQEPVTRRLLLAALLICAGLLVIHLRTRRLTEAFPLGRHP
jgi:drug/metabolite transporter (DMT)-like permease